MLTITDAELHARGASTIAAEELTATDGPPVIVAQHDDTTWTPDAVANLASLPCIVISEPRPPDVTGPLDAIAEPGVVEVDDLLAAISANPGAALSLVLLQRGADRRSVAEGLIAESTTYSMLQAGPEFATWLEHRVRRRSRPATGEPALARRDGNRLDVTLNRPEVHNALNAAMRDALGEALSVAISDERITTVLLRGAGPTFCSGGDLDEFGSAADPVASHRIRLATSVARLLDRLAPRVEAHVHGACRGSGVELAAFATTVTARADTTFALPEVAMGLIPGAGGTVSITRRIGRVRATSLALSGSVIDTPTALSWGLVDTLEG